jgi:O-methyltransferase
MNMSLRRLGRAPGRLARELKGLRAAQAAPPAPPALPPDFDASDVATVNAVRPFTMTSPERIWALRNAVKHITEARIDGTIVECGVWRGGSMMTVARTLLELGDSSRELYLFDTFEGMPPPTEHDVMYTGAEAADLLASQPKDSRMWGAASQDEVEAALRPVGYPWEKLHFVAGKVEDTIPDAAPERIALLRLDTDWYESTLHELEHLYPRLARGGVLIIDDYGHWQGARRAVDEYFEREGIQILLNRVDYTARITVKP